MRFHLGEEVYIRARNGSQVDHRIQTVVRIDTYRRFSARPSTARYYMVAPLGTLVPERDLYRKQDKLRPAVSSEKQIIPANVRMQEAIEHGTLLDSTPMDSR